MPDEKDVLAAISAFYVVNGIMPTMRDLCEMTGIKSKSTVKARLEKLAALGKVVYHPGIPRGLAWPKEAKK